MSQISSEEAGLDKVLTSDVISKLTSAIDTWMAGMGVHRTVRLWFMYMHLVSILRSFIRSARTGNWALYLQVFHEMLPYFAAAGHNNYTKSLMLYLQKMEALPVTHPDVYARFQEGYFVVRRSDSHWTGMFSDLCIEQVLMGGVKLVGGLTRGRGFDETTSLIGLLSMPACGEMHNAMQTVTGLSDMDHDDKHKDLTKARLQRDGKDMQKIIDLLEERKPFSNDNTDLHSLSSGVVADPSVNVDSAEMAGSSILESMVGKSVLKYKFSRKEQVVTLASSLYVSVDGEKMEIDPKHLYQRLLVAGIGNTDPEVLFQYELCSYPSSLCDTRLLLRAADKANIQNGLVKRLPMCHIEENHME